MPDSSMSEFDKSNFNVPGSPRPFAEGNVGRGPGMFEPRGKVNFSGVDNNSDDQERNHDVEDIIANRAYYRPESMHAELINTAETPHELFIGLRGLEKMLEDGSIPGSLAERYTPPRELSIMWEKAELLSMSIDQLLANGWIRKDSYNPKTGTGVPKNRKYAALAMSVEEIPIILEDKEGNKRQVGADLEYNFGTPEKRAQLEKAYKNAILELEARSILGEHIDIRLNLDFRDNLEGLVGIMHSGRVPKFKSEHLKALFNMPGLNELSANPENHVLGDQVEEAMFLNLVMLKSGTKNDMQELLARPGAKHLIAKMAKEAESRMGRTYTYDNWIKDNIGDVDSWTDDTKRELDTYKTEATKGLRKDLTKWSNIAAFAGSPGDFGGDDEVHFIEKTIGGLVGSVEASWLAATLMRSIGAYASEGYVALPNGKSSLPLGEGRYISSDDTGKFYAYMFNMKEGLKGRTSGLKNMIGKIPDTAMNLFDWAQVKVDLNGKSERRSIWDAWLGTSGGKKKTDLLTGKETGEIIQEEAYHRLGSLKFESLDREFHGTFTIMQWLLGNREGPTGVFIEAMRTDFKYEDFTLNQLKKVWKYIGITFNPIVMTKGSPHLYKADKETYKTIQKNFLRNMILSRINSYSFTTNVLNHTIPMLEADYKDAGIPAPVLVRAFAKEILKDDPQDEEEVKKHYLDSYDTLIHLGRTELGPITIKTAGTMHDRFAILSEKFEPENPTKEELERMRYVGRVTGKKKI